MKLLLDTHALLWFLADDPRLSPTAKTAIEDLANERWLSPISLLEIALKNRLGKLPLPERFSTMFPADLAAEDIHLLPLEPQHIEPLTTLPLHHKDPFDRLIANPTESEAPMIRRLVLAAALVGASAGGTAFAAVVTFTPLSMPQGNAENRTGMWFCPDLGKASDILPLKTRVWATKESVTGGVPMKCVFDKGSRGKVAYEEDAYPAGSAGLTLYTKASRPLVVTVGNIPAEVGADWRKLDFPWEKLGADPAKPRIGFQFVVAVKGPIEERTWLILDRVGTESPRFDPKPAVEPQSGPDKTISSKDILYGAENLERTRRCAKAKLPFKVIALGDSVTAGAQAYRGTWDVKGDEGVPFLYFAHFARLAGEHFGYEGIKPVQHGHGGWTAAQALKVVDKEVVDEAGPDDLVILQFGGNDLTWAKTTPAAWKADMKKLIARVKTKTDQIIVMSTTPIGEVGKLRPEITKVLQELVKEENIAAVDITRFAYYRGEPFAWAWLANEGHPSYMGHITLAEMMAPLLTGSHRDYPE